MSKHVDSTSPVFKVSDHPTIGDPVIRIDHRQEEMRALLDIYHETMRNQALLQHIITRINTPWYTRLAVWVKKLFRGY